MNFTREPIIETVIMPREGFKLLVRNSKGTGQEEYYVDSVEVISFGSSLFFRSQERPKSFIVPVSDYEILEQKEARMSLKNVAPERAIKIGGGREGGMRQQSRESVPETDSYEPQERDRPEQPQQQQPPIDRDRKRDKRRRGRRGGGGRSEAPMQDVRDQPPMDDRHPADRPPEERGMSQGASFREGPREPRIEDHKAPSFISKLFPPPPTLIKETLGRYKPAEPPEEESPFLESEEKFDDAFFEPPLSAENKAESEEDEPPFEE